MKILFVTLKFYLNDANYNLNFPLYIAKRYLFSKSSKNAINIISFVTWFAVVIGTFALFLVLSVFSGLKEFSSSFIRVSDPDLKISSTKGKSFFITDSLTQLLQDDRIAHYSKVIEEKAFFNYKEKQHIATIKGVDAHYLSVNNIDTAVYIGNWIDTDISNSAVIGNGVSSVLSLGTYDFEEPLKAYVPKPGKGYVTNLKNAFNQISLQPVGIFKLTNDLDVKYVFSSLTSVQQLLKYEPNRITAVELKLVRETEEDEVISYLNDQLATNFKVETRKQLNAVFYKMINTENLISYLVVTLIVIIALFNVAGTILMVIIDKRENLKTLFSFGAKLKDIRRIFVLQGFLLTLIGLLVGLSLSILVVLLQKKFGFIMITQSLAYPVEFKVMNVVVVFFTIIVLGYVSAKIASSRISSKTIQ